MESKGPDMQLPDSELRNICRQKIESLEHWLRRMIDEILTDAYGDFFEHQDQYGNRLINNQLVKSISQRIENEPDRYSRKVDAILLDDAIDIICKPDLYKLHFKPALADAFPDGQSEARTMMKRLSEPRNRLAHANTISLRQYEQVVCYTGDIIESIKNYYGGRSMDEEYNVPLILKVIDSFGNAFYRDQLQSIHQGAVLVNLAEDENYYLRPGETLALEVEVDPSFSEDEYEIDWAARNAIELQTHKGKKLTIEITDKHVTKMFTVQCKVRSNKTWHRLPDGIDDMLTYAIRVLPPI